MATPQATPFAKWLLTLWASKFNVVLPSAVLAVILKWVWDKLTAPTKALPAPVAVGGEVIFTPPVPLI